MSIVYISCRFVPLPNSGGSSLSPTDNKKPEAKGGERPDADQVSFQQQNTATQRSRLGKRRRTDTMSDIIDLTQE